MNAQTIIAQWPTRRALADAIGVPRYAVKNWFHRNSIPPEHYKALVKAAGDIGVSLTLDDLVSSRDAETQRAA